MSIKLIHYDTLDLNNLCMHNPIVEDNKVICELSYNKLEPFMFFLDSLKVIKFTNSEIILDLRNNDNIKNLFDNIDEHIISLIKERKLVKTYELKKFTYITLLNTYTTSNGESYDVLKLNINMSGDYKTSMFFKYGEPINNLNVMQTEITVKTIFECFNLTFNKVNKTIYLDNSVRQLKVKQLRPIRIKEMDYSFVDSDNESSVLNKDFNMTLNKIYESENNNTSEEEINTKEKNEVIDVTLVNNSNTSEEDINEEDNSEADNSEEDNSEKDNLNASDLKEIDALRMFNEKDSDSDDNYNDDENNDIFENTSCNNDTTESSADNFAAVNDIDDDSDNSDNSDNSDDSDI
jgi:hypothetical protein